MTWRRFETTWAARAQTAAALAVVATVCAGCGGGGEPTVDVLAAASFTDVAQPLEALLEDELGVDIRFSFGSSGSFLEQIDQGAPASVVMTADSATMSRIEQAGLVEQSVPITRNDLIIVTATTEAGRSIESLADLAADGSAAVVVCASSAPCGAATDELLELAGVIVAPVSREPNVRATLTKVLLGEADAALVYRTDAMAHPELRAVEVGADNVSVVGRAASVKQRDERGAEIIAVLSGDRAAALFADAGFGAP